MPVTNGFQIKSGTDIGGNLHFSSGGNIDNASGNLIVSGAGDLKLNAFGDAITMTAAGNITNTAQTMGYNITSTVSDVRVTAGDEVIIDCVNNMVFTSSDGNIIFNADGDIELNPGGMVTIGGGGATLEDLLINGCTISCNTGPNVIFDDDVLLTAGNFFKTNTTEYREFSIDTNAGNFGIVNTGGTITLSPLARIVVEGNVRPDVPNTHNLGSSVLPFNDVYATRLRVERASGLFYEISQNATVDCFEIDTHTNCILVGDVSAYTITGTLAAASRSGIIGGWNHTLDDTSGNPLNSFIIGGTGNTMDTSDQSVILGGITNIIDSTANNCTILGGSTNTISGGAGNSSIIAGANSTIADDDNCLIAAGNTNMITNGARSVIIGCDNGTIDTTGNCCSILNTDTGIIRNGCTRCTVIAGNASIIENVLNGSMAHLSQECTIVGGDSNAIYHGSQVSIMGGANNQVADSTTELADNQNRYNNSGIFAGNGNIIRIGVSLAGLGCEKSTIIGGSNNEIFGGIDSSIISS